MKLFGWRKRKETPSKHDVGSTSGSATSSKSTAAEPTVPKGLGENGAAKKQVDLVTSRAEEETPHVAGVSSADRSPGKFRLGLKADSFNEPVKQSLLHDSFLYAHNGGAPGTAFSDEKIVDAISNQPEIWETRMPPNKNRLVRIGLWNDVLRAMGFSVTRDNLKYIKKRWNYIRGALYKNNSTLSPELKNKLKESMRFVYSNVADMKTYQKQNGNAHREVDEDPFRDDDDCEEDVKPIINLGNPRNKCALKPGHSLMDWIRLGSSGVDLTGTRGVRRPISHTELAKHCTQNDAWMAIHGKCYNVTEYMDFHPGGIDELMKGVGTDATKIFNEVHAWVNYEQLLAKCYLGPLTPSAGPLSAEPTIKTAVSATQLSVETDDDADAFKKPPISAANLNLALCGGGAGARKTSTSTNINEATGAEKSASLPVSPTESLQDLCQDVPNVEIIPRFDWIQKTSELVIVFYTRALCNPGFSVEWANAKRAHVRIFIGKSVHLCTFSFTNGVRWPCTTRVSNETGKIELVFKKEDPALWTSFGILDRRKISDVEEVSSFEYEAVSREQITHDSFAVVLMPKQRVVQHVPVGYHLRITYEDKVHGEITRSFTPVPAGYLPKPCSAPVTSVPLLVKQYPSGLLSKYLTTVEPMATRRLQISQPRGAFSLYKIRLHTRVAMLAAGSGLTPILSILDYLVERTNNKIQSITLFYFNKTESDIWCRKKLKDLALKDKRVRIKFILSANPTPSGWPPQQTGRMNTDLMATLCDKTSEHYSTYSFVCGPPGFNEECQKLIQAAGVDLSRVHVFH